MGLEKKIELKKIGEENETEKYFRVVFCPFAERNDRSGPGDN
jgi:hypothetical protein